MHFFHIPEALSTQHPDDDTFLDSSLALLSYSICSVVVPASVFASLSKVTSVTSSVRGSLDHFRGDTPLRYKSSISASVRRAVSGLPSISMSALLVEFG